MHGPLSTESWIDLKKGGLATMTHVGQTFLRGWHMFNNSAATHYVKFYDKATQADETDTPKFVIAIGTKGMAQVQLPGDGISFAKGLCLRCVTGIANNDVTDPTTNDSVGMLTYNFPTNP